MSQTSAIVDKLLTNVSRKYVPEDQSFIAEKVLTPLKTAQSSGKIASYGGEHLRISSYIVNGDTQYPQVVSTARSSTTYQTEKHALKGYVTEEDYANVEKPFEAESDMTIDLTLKLRLEKEKALADQLTSTSVITQNVTLSGTSQLSDYTNSDPVGVFATARATVKDACGVAPIKALMSWHVWEQLRYHPDLIAFVSQSSSVIDGLNEQQLANALGVRKILIGDSFYNSSAEGQTDVLSPVWGKHIVFLVAPDTAAKTQVSAGYLVQQRNPRRVFKAAVDDPPNSKKILVDDSYDQVITDVKAAYLVKDAVA